MDPEVSSKLFHEAVRGYLKDKLVVLATHQIQYLEHCEQILLLKEGKVVACGDFAEITATGFNIKDILDSFNKALQKKKDKEIVPQKEWTVKCRLEDAPTAQPYVVQKEWAYKCPPLSALSKEWTYKCQEADRPDLYVVQTEWKEKCPVPKADSTAAS